MPAQANRVFSDANEMAGSVSKGLHIKPSLVYVSSTGVIGSTMPMDRIRPAITELVSGVGRSSFEDVAAAIMTTDTFPENSEEEGQSR